MAFSRTHETSPSSSGQLSILDQSQVFDHFLATVERRAFRIAHFATRDTDEALDVVQDAMYQLVQRYASRKEVEWGPLFYRILYNKIQDWRRRTWVRRRWRVCFGDYDAKGQEGEDPLEGIPDAGKADPFSYVVQKRAVKALQTALRELPFRQQQAFLLRVWEGFDVSQTARTMGCSEGSVKTHYFRAIHTLREQLADYWP